MVEVAHMGSLIMILSIDFSFLHCSLKVESRIFSYSAVETSPLRYKFQANKKAFGSDITLVSGIVSNIFAKNE